MDIKKEFDSKNATEHILDVHIKQEPELIIDNNGQWTPAKFDDEEKEYYQELFEECNQIVVQDASGSGNYTIKFLDETKSYVEDESDDYSEGEYDEWQNSNSDEDFETLNENFDDLDYSKVPHKSEYSAPESQLQSNRLLTANFVEYECPICAERFFRYMELRQHFEQNHKDAIAETEKNYFFRSLNCGVCKKCNKEFSSISFRYFHSMKHDENNAQLQISICNVCNFKAKKRSFVQKHVFKKHPEVMKEFKVLEMWYHFMDKHPYEDKSKIVFSCHLCVCESFDKEESFLQHLADNHALKSFHTLNFRKIIEDKEYVACTMCGSLFVQNDTFKLLKHFLKHEDNSFWTCKFCSKKISFQKISLRHMCIELIEHYNKRNYENNSIDTSYPEQKECQIKNLQEFENYIEHVCPFCNKEFNKMLKWQQHLKRIHAIETLKGLEMKKLVNDDTKLYCVICHAVVPNSPEKLHAHRFQHLPFKPYKCFSCSCPLSTFQMAVNHILKLCKDEDDRSLAKNIWNRKDDKSVSDIRSFLEIQCSLCNQKKFNDVKSTFKHYEDEHNSFEELFVKNSDNSVTCKICYKQLVYNDKNPYFLHIINHFDDKTFRCKLCLQSYSTLKGINYHFLSHPSTKSIFQQACKKEDQNPVSLPDNNDGVTKNVTTLAVSSIKSHVLNEFAEFIGFVCPECNEDMGSQPMWHTHIATQHNFFNESDIYFKDVDGSLKCTTCKMKLPTSTIQQQKHKLTHMPYKSFMCNLCYVRCNSLGVLYGHFRNKHFAKGSFACPICPDILPTSHQRTKHLKDKHPREKWPASMCLICYQILATSSGLRTHMRIHDVDRFKYTCEVCGSKIIELKDFNSHMERHKKRGQIKDKFERDMTSSSKSADNQSSVQTNLSGKCQEDLHENEENRNKKTELFNELKDKCLEQDKHTVVFPATKKRKYATEEI